MSAELFADLARAGRDAVGQGLALASGGNLSARLPGTATFAVTATGTWLDRLTDEDFSILDLDGAVLAGNPVPSVEWRLHAHTYRARPDVNAVVHLHPQHTVLLDALGHEIRLITLDHVLYVGSIGRVPFLPAGSTELAVAAADAVRDNDCVVLAHHGSSTVGGDVAMALRRALNLEQAATTTLRCLQLGDTELSFPAEWIGRHLQA